MYFDTKPKGYISYGKRKPLRYKKCPICSKQLTKHDKQAGYCSCILDRYKLSSTTVDGVELVRYLPFKQYELRSEFYTECKAIRESKG